MKKPIDRREFLKKTAATLSAAGAMGIMGSPVFPAPFLRKKNGVDRVYVLGIDGMDPLLLKKFVSRGDMPAFEKLMGTGHFGQLQTTIPPQSPVAWSSFISGSNPGVHGIFDFIHRDPETFVPYLSTSRSFAPEKTLRLGNLNIPIKGGRVDLLRRGPAFWEVLEENDIPATFFKLPANFPVQPSKSQMISGMGTPDLLGSYGTFTLFAEEPVSYPDNLPGGRIQRILFLDHAAHATIEGPPNSLRADEKPVHIDFTIHRDPVNPSLFLEIQGQRLLLTQGEWSGWVPLKFEMLPLLSDVQGIVRFYVQKVHSGFRLYMSPIQIDPASPHVPIASPSNHSRDIAKAIGRFYTQGFPEDTKALSHGIFSDEEFLIQSNIVFEERLHAFDHELNRFNDGLFFFYFSSVDQNTHMLWHNMDPEHPLYDEGKSPEIKNGVYSFYRKMDDVLKQTMDKLDDRSVLMIMSDHGFAPFRREFQLSTWMAQNEWTGITDPHRMHESTFYDFVDWQKTKAYAMGLNGVYINLREREFEGSVDPADYESVKTACIRELESIRDPLTGKRIIAKAYDALKTYRGPYADQGPDIIVGYERGYRISDEAGLGMFPEGIIRNRQDKWAADHCMAAHLVPGVLLSNREVIHPEPGIWDLAPSILHLFGLSPAEPMDGRSVFA